MQLQGREFLTTISTEPPSGGLTIPVTWPDVTKSRIGVVASSKSVSISANADPALKILHVDFQRNVDGAVMNRLHCEQAGSAGGIIGTWSDRVVALPVSPASACPYWLVNQADGFSLVLSPFQVTTGGFAFSARIRLDYTYILIDANGAPIVPNIIPAVPRTIHLIDVQGVNKEILALRDDGTIWRCPDVTVATPVWTQITNP